LLSEADAARVATEAAPAAESLPFDESSEHAAAIGNATAAMVVSRRVALVRMGNSRQRRCPACCLFMD
jgi:hypothetical protein